MILQVVYTQLGALKRTE